MPRRFSVITKTYHGDLASFKDLCRSIDELMPDVVHHVLVDQSDLRLFQPFAGPNRKIINASALLPQFREFNIGSRRLWWRWPYYLARGWTFQQLVKIAYSSLLDDDAILHVDSDMMFVRPVTEGHLFDGDRVKMYHRPGQAAGPEFQKWHNVASRSLGLPETGYTGFDYISNAVVWSPEVVRAMIEQINRTSGRKWFDALISNFRFSEYIIYGVFCDQVEGGHSELVSPVTKELCHCSWHYDLASEEGIRTFVLSVQPHHAGILLQSNLGLSKAQRDAIFERFVIS